MCHPNRKGGHTARGCKCECCESARAYRLSMARPYAPGSRFVASVTPLDRARIKVLQERLSISTKSMVVRLALRKLDEATA